MVNHHEELERVPLATGQENVKNSFENFFMDFGGLPAPGFLLEKHPKLTARHYRELPCTL